MNHRLLFVIASSLVLGLALGAAGCARTPDGPPAPPPVAVPVSVPVERYVTDTEEFTASLAAVDSVTVKAHAWGYLQKVNFKEGALVKKGDVLFEIDPRPYQALLDQAKAKVRQDQAQLKFDEAEYKRNLQLSYTGAASQSDLDKAASARDVDVANIAADRAAVVTAELNLQYTKVIAPVSGRVSNYSVTVGNLIQSGDQGGGTQLTTLMSVDPIYAYFDVDEHTVQRAGWMVHEDQDTAAGAAPWPVSLALSTETGFPHQGTINFVDNQVAAKTGTLRVRGVFPNPDGKLLPGFFARVRIPVGPAHPALLVNDQTLDNDQGQKVLYVVNDSNEVVVRPVRVGALHDGLREIAAGLKAGDRVVVNGLQFVRPGAVVEPKLVDMPVGLPK